MLPTAILRQYACRITFFTRQNCSLCVDAKTVLTKVWERKPFEYTEIDVMAPQQERWKALYEFDTPVIHVDKCRENSASFQTSEAARKLMHRFDEKEVEKVMDEEMMKPLD